MNENKQLVIVFSRNYSTGLSVIRSLGAAGYTVDLVATSRKAGDAKIAACSKYVRNWVEVIERDEETDEESQELLEQLLKYAQSGGQKPILFPTDDYTTSVMDIHRSVLEPHFIMPYVAAEDGRLLTRMAKVFQAELAQKAGLLIPKEWILSLEEEIKIPEDMVYPCFVKPLESVVMQGKRMSRCSSPEALQWYLEKLQDEDAHRSVRVQEFLEIENEIDFSGVCLDQQVIIPAIIKKWNVAKHKRGVTLAGTVVPAEELGELQDKIVAMLQQFHYVGMFDMELIAAGDKVYFNEVNLRSGVPNFAYYMNGVNLPALYVKEALGQKHDPEEEKIKQFGKTFICEDVAWDDYFHGHMNRRELEDRIAAADITLLNNQNDPAPGKCFEKKIKWILRHRKIKRIKQKIKKRLSKMKNNLRKSGLGKILRAVKYTVLGYPQMKKTNRRNPFAESPRVVVAGRNYCSNLTMARAVGSAGYEIEVLHVFQVRPKWTRLNKYMRPDAYSKFIKAYHVCVFSRKAKNIIDKLIRMADPYRKMLLIPADDLVADIVDEHMDKLRPYYVMPNVNDAQGEISRLMSKEVQKELARAAGLPVVNSCVIRTTGGRFEIPESVTYPCFIKPNISKNSSKSRMRRCDNAEELTMALTEFSQKKDIEMLVEDYMEIDQECAILGLSTKDGVVAPGYFEAEEGGHDAHRGVALIGKTVPCAEEQELIDDIVKFVATLNLEGLFDVDLIRTPKGKLFFTELNLRFGGSGHAITLSGVNLPGMFADYMLKGKPIDLNCKLEQTGKRFISEKIMFDEYMSGYLTMSEMKKRMDDVDIHFIYSEDDPKAYRHFKKFYRLAQLYRFLVETKKKLTGGE